MTTTKLLTEQVTESRTAPTGGATGNSELCFVTKARVNQGNHQCTFIAEYSGILVSLDSLTIGKQQQWLKNQPEPKTKEEIQARKRVKRLIKLSRDEESE